MKRFSETILAAAAFATALGGTLIGLPLVLDAPALAASGPAGDQHFPLPSERIEARLAYIKTALKITDAQTAQWNAFADVMRRHAKDVDVAITAMRGSQDDNLTIIDRLEKHRKMMAKQADNLQELLAVGRPLYASLSDEQKKTADELLTPHFGGMRGFRHGPGHEMRGPGEPSPKP